MNKYVKIIVCVLSCISIGYLSGIVTQTSVATWYPTLVKPSFNPPNWAFPIAWSLLYTFMGVAAGLVWARMDYDMELVKKALVFFVIQLALNSLWSFLFFGLKNPMLALIEIVLLWLMIYETYIKFKKIDKFAGFLFIPYLLWVTFAGVLNGNIWWLNR
jgi:translocator protein